MGEIHSNGDGADSTVISGGDHIIYDAGGTDSISFANGSVADTQMSRKGDDLILENGDSRVTIKDHFNEGNIETIEFTDGKLSDISERGATIAQAAGDNEDPGDTDFKLDPRLEITTKKEPDGTVTTRIEIGVGFDVTIEQMFEAIADIFRGGNDDDSCGDNGAALIGTPGNPKDDDDHKPGDIQEGDAEDDFPDDRAPGSPF